MATAAIVASVALGNEVDGAVATAIAVEERLLLVVVVGRTSSIAEGLSYLTIVGT